MSIANRFTTTRAAKEYLIGRIVAESVRMGVPLSDLEGEMLSFTEEGGLSEPMARANEEFERNYDSETYERKIAGIVCSLESNSSAEEREKWDDAVLKLSDEDHYLLVLIGAPVNDEPTLLPIPEKLRPWLPDLDGQNSRPKGDLKRLILVALVGSVLFFIVAMIFAGR